MSRFSLIYIGSFLILLSIFSFFNIIYSYYFNIFLNVDTYLYTFIISTIIGLFFLFFKKIEFKKIFIYEKILTVLFGYVFFPLIISIPFYFSIYNISFLNCYFEAISGFTSTGFTVFDNVKQIEVYQGPQSYAYGHNAMAGLINIKTMDPRSERTTKKKLTIGNDELLQASYFYNAPLIENTLLMNHLI